MWNFLLDTHDVGVVGGGIGEDNITDGYGIPTGEFTATDGLILFFVILGIIFFIYLVLKFSIFLVKKFVFNAKDKDEDITKNNS